MEEIDVFKSMREAGDSELIPFVDEKEAARLKLIAEHKAWLKKIKKEHPSPYQFFKVGVYIRYFNQTKYRHAPTVIIAPITSKTKKSNLPTHVKLTSKCLERNSVALLEQIKTIDKTRIEAYIGTLSDDEMKPIEKALRISLGLGRYKNKRG